ncbi:MAG: DegV family protein [Christensenellaceae bacterium]
MEKYLIYADVSADIIEESIDRYSVRFVPMQYVHDGEEKTCFSRESDVAMKAFYDSQRNGSTMHSSQISPQNYIDVFAPIMEQGYSILYLCLSSGLSGTFQSSLTAEKELNEKYAPARIICVDSLGATAGMGLLLESIGDNRAAGMSLEENAEWVKNNRLKVCHQFMVDDLMFLKRGGRIPATTAVVGKLLNIKPALYIDGEGKLINYAKKQGVKNVLNHLSEQYAAKSFGGENERVLIIHSDDLEKAAYLEEKVKEINPTAKISKLMMGPIIGCHTGPGMCGIVFYGNRLDN